MDAGRVTRLDIGYDPSSLSWTFVGPHKVMKTCSFESEHSLVGERAIRLLNAAKRISQYDSGATIQGIVGAIRKCVAAICTYAANSDSPEEWAAALAMHLRSIESLAENSRWGVFDRANRVMSEVARYERKPYRVSNRFVQGRTTSPELVTQEHQATLVRCAKRDAWEYVKRFRSPVQDHVPFIEAARDLASRANGLFIITEPRSAEHRLYEKWCRTTKLGIRELTGYLYPSGEHLVSILILLVHELAGNADSVSLMRRDAMMPFVHPAYGECHKLTLEKPRAGSIGPYQLRGNGTLSVAWLINAVLETTQSVVEAALPAHRNYAFLINTGHGRVRPMIGYHRFFNVREYHKRIGLEPVTLPQLRHTRGIDEYNRTGDVFRVKRLLNQSSITTTLHYLDPLLTHDTNAAGIADVQQRMLVTPPTTPRIKKNGLPASAGSHGCLNPQDPTKDHYQQGFCATFLWPFNDRHFAFDFSPRPVAFYCEITAPYARHRNSYLKHALITSMLLESTR
jgi:hypothetical protein